VENNPSFNVIDTLYTILNSINIDDPKRISNKVFLLYLNTLSLKNNKIKEDIYIKYFSINKLKYSIDNYRLDIRIQNKDCYRLSFGNQRRYEPIIHCIVDKNSGPLIEYKEYLIDLMDRVNLYKEYLILRDI
jgi:hypothetical protein